MHEGPGNEKIPSSVEASFVRARDLKPGNVVEFKPFLDIDRAFAPLAPQLYVVDAVEEDEHGDPVVWAHLRGTDEEPKALSPLCVEKVADTPDTGKLFH